MWVDYTRVSADRAAETIPQGPVALSTGLDAGFASWSLTLDETWAIIQNGLTLATPMATTADAFTARPFIVAAGPDNAESRKLPCNDGRNRPGRGIQGSV